MFGLIYDFMSSNKSGLPACFWFYELYTAQSAGFEFEARLNVRRLSVSFWSCVVPAHLPVTSKTIAWWD
jgi:hypothetical protein